MESATAEKFRESKVKKSESKQCLSVCRVESDWSGVNARRSPRTHNSQLQMLPLRRSPRFCPPPQSQNWSRRTSPRFSGAECGTMLPAFQYIRKRKREIMAVRKNGKELSLTVNCVSNKITSGSPMLSPFLLGNKSDSSESALLVIVNGVSEETTYDSRVPADKQLSRALRFSISAENGDTEESLIRSDTMHSDENKLGRSPQELFPSDGEETERPSKRAKNQSTDSEATKLDANFSLPFANVDNFSIDVEEDEMKNSLVELPYSVEKQSSEELFAFKDEDIDGKNALIELPKTVEKQSLIKLAAEYSHKKTSQYSSGKKQKKESICCLVGEPLPDDEAQEKWGWRYEMKNKKLNCRRQRAILDDDDDEDKIVWNVECHYLQADIDGSILKLGDCAYVKGVGKEKHIGRIVEFFRTTDKEDYFRVQWFYKAVDTVMKDAAANHDKKRIFYSTVMNDNPINCIISKVNVVQKSPKMNLKVNSNRSYDFYFDMEYSVDYSTFRTLSIGNSFDDSSLPDVVEAALATSNNSSMESLASSASYKTKLALLDIFSGCGGMSTGLCFGAKVSGVDLVTKWALDYDRSACDSLKLNHPEAHVRNEAAEDFLSLLKEWKKLTKLYVVNDVDSSYHAQSMSSNKKQENEDFRSEDDMESEEFEVSRIVDICYGDPAQTGKRGLHFKVHWKGYSSSEDTWEPSKGLSNCQECIRDFVRKGFASKILPLPGDVDVICGGPPCQGISGYNRFRNVQSPLTDERNRQIIIFMDIVQYLEPKFVLMENVLDILKFDKASLARYALSRLVGMKYQARLGTMAAGCYGLPQFRMRVFLWGAHPNEKLPQFPLPTHDVIIRYWPPSEFERNTVAYDENQSHKLRELEKATVLQDAISDLPAVTSHEDREEMNYDKEPETVFQTFIRSTKYDMGESTLNGIAKSNNKLYDHRPYSLTEDDYARVCLIPKRKGANFRDLPGVIVGSDNTVRRDPSVEETLPSGKPLVPDFALTFEGAKSKRPYARLWWDETVSTVVTFPDLHSMVIVHPEQDRVLTLRECARLQGFPDYYRFCGTVKHRYRQIGNAVAVPVGRALGYAMGMAFQKISGDEPLMTLPPKFSHSTNLQLAKSLFEKNE